MLESSSRVPIPHFEFRAVAGILNSNYGRHLSRTRRTWGCVVSRFRDQVESSGGHAAVSARLGDLVPPPPNLHSSCGSSQHRSLSEGLATIARCAFALVCLLLAPTQVWPAQGAELAVSDAWVPAADEVGRDVPLLVAIKNETDSADALIRIRCPVSNFSEKHAVDRGEGAPAMRSISSIPIAASSTVVLKPNEYHVMLLQTRQPLAVGERFKCALVFQKAGTIETEVEVRRSP